MNRPPGLRPAAKSSPSISLLRPPRRPSYVVAVLPATLLPDARRRSLAESLAALGETPPPNRTPGRERWAVTIRDAAKFAAAYRWRMLWGCVLTGVLLAMLAYGLAQLWPSLSLAEWAYRGGVRGIEAARWLFGAGA